MNTNIKTTPLKDFTSINAQERKDLGIRAGDTVKVWVKIKEKDKYRLQAFEGMVLATKHGTEPGATFTVRKVSNGVGVERIFPLYSPAIDKIEIVKRARVRRAKLYHIREKVAREIKRQMRRTEQVSISTLSDLDEQDRIAKEAEAAEAEAKRVEEEAAAAEAKKAEEAKAAEEKAVAEATPTEENIAETSEDQAEALENPEDTAEAVEAVQEVANDHETVEEKTEETKED